MPAKLNILIADDDDGDRKEIKRALQQTKLLCDFTETATIKEALEACETCAFDCAIIDYRLPDQDGLAGLSALHERLPYMAIIMATGQGDELVATEAMKRGASDYIPKALIDERSIRRSIENGVERATLQKKIAQQREELEIFTRVLVHDLKAPIHSVQGFASLIERSIQEGKPEEIVSYARPIVNAVERMGALIDTLQQYTRAEQHVLFQPLEMRQVMLDTLSNLDGLIQERGALVTFGNLPAVSGNAPQLTQLLQNLVGNGIKYCSAAIPAVQVAATLKEGNVWLFTVQDNGIGVPEKYYQQVFEPFQRLPGAARYEGTGLGLATCKKIVERHGGRIWCESKEGRGTAFFFTLNGA
jgi:signal transduction histidine kinase